METKRALTQAAERYIATLKSLSNPLNSTDAITALCHQDCRKVRNGKVLFEGTAFFAAQLEGGRQWLGKWTIPSHEVHISTNYRTAIVKYELSTEKEGDLLVIALLHFDSNHLIQEINEVHNKLEK